MRPEPLRRCSGKACGQAGEKSSAVFSCAANAASTPPTTSGAGGRSSAAGCPVKATVLRVISAAQLAEEAVICDTGKSRCRTQTPLKFDKARAASVSIHATCPARSAGSLQLTAVAADAALHGGRAAADRQHLLQHLLQPHRRRRRQPHVSQACMCRTKVQHRGTGLVADVSTTFRGHEWGGSAIQSKICHLLSRQRS